MRGLFLNQSQLSVYKNIFIRTLSRQIILFYKPEMGAPDRQPARSGWKRGTAPLLNLGILVFSLPRSY